MHGSEIVGRKRTLRRAGGVNFALHFDQTLPDRSFLVGWTAWSTSPIFERKHVVGHNNADPAPAIVCRCG